MARSPVTKRAVKVGNYAQDVDMTGEAGNILGSVENPTAMTKVERSYVKGTGRPSAIKAVQRARKANKQPPARS